MDIIDFRYRPPYGSYRETIMYRDLERARRCSEAFGMTQSPAVAARDMEASLAEMDRAGIGMAVLAGRKVLPHIGVVDNQDNPLPSLPMSPEPAIPMEPAALLARSDRISPNIFSAAITSKYPGLLTRRAAQPSISMVS